MNTITSSQVNNVNRKKFNKLDYRVKELNLIIPEPAECKEKENNNEVCLFACDVLTFENIFVSPTKRNLRLLVVIGQPGITSLNGISELVNLQELWVVECLLEDISDLEECKRLEKLYLYSNNISRLPNMSKSVELTLMSLSGNNVRQLENLQSMPNLRELYIARNKIERIGESFPKNSHLSVINVAGNHLYELKDICNLSFISNLRHVVFADAMYGECPVVSLCNYRHFVVKNLSSLIELDHYPVTVEERSYATQFFKSKMMFYDMLCNKYRDQFTKSLNDRLEENRKRVSDYRKDIYSAKLEQLRISRSNKVGLRSRELLSNEILRHINNRMELDDACEKEWLENAETDLQILQRQLNLKAQRYGNMNFVEYVPDAEGNTLVKICQDLCTDSLCQTVKNDLGIKGVRVHKVTKVINNETDAFRKAKYENESIDRDQEGSESIFQFLVRPVGVGKLQNWPFEIFERDFFDAVMSRTDTSRPNSEAEIIATDCLAAADADWMREISLAQKSSSISSSVFSKRRIAILVQLPISTLTNAVRKLDNYHAMHSDHDKYNCQCMSLVEPELVKPVFVVEFEYVTKRGSESDAVSEESPYVKVASRNSLNYTWARMNIENLGRCLKLTELDVEKLQVIDLSGRGICVIDVSTPLPNLRELYLSCNKLTALPHAVMLKYVTKLDVSLNDIRIFDITASLPLLKSFNFAWNLAEEFFTVLKTLENFTPNLTTINLEHNPFLDVTDAESMSLLAQNAVPSLKCFNENIIENCVYARPFDRSGVDIFENADMVKLDESNKSLTSPLSIIGNKWRNMEYLNLSNNHLSSVEFVTEFHKQRELCITNNLLVNFFLKNPVHQLTKLNLRGNFLMTIDGLTQENLPLLNYLDLCDNLITSLVAMGSFDSLTQFYCTHNRIAKLQNVYNLKDWQGLKIIDISNNPIDSISLCNKFLIFQIPEIEYVGGKRVTASEILEANHTFGGSLDREKIMKMSCNLQGDLTYLKQLSIVDCAIKKVNLPADLLPNLESLDLSKNQITTLWGLHTLKKLHVLCLTNNRVETSTPVCSEEVLSTCLFPSLHTLFLDYNGIQTLVKLNLENMPELKYLYMQHNELQDVDGLQRCVHLETLVLDNNKIQMIAEANFHVDNTVKNLFLENNKIKFLSFVKRLSKITKLFLSNNKVADKDQLKHLGNMELLKEITILGNPLCKRTNHYKYVLQALGTLTRIDGHSMALEEDLDSL